MPPTLIQPREIQASRLKTIGLLAGSLAFVAAGAFIQSRSPTIEPMAWLCMVFFGLGVVVAIVQLVRPQRLLLDNEGFTLVGGMVRRPRKERWADVRGFVVFRLPRGGTMVGYNYAPGAEPKSKLLAISRGMGCDAGLGKGWPGGDAAMVEQLNAYRQQALSP